MATDGNIWNDPNLPVAVPVPVPVPTQQQRDKQKHDPPQYGEHAQSPSPSAPPPPTSSYSPYDPTADPTYSTKLSTLRSQGFPSGLSTSLIQRTQNSFPLRLWIIDNSGSMNAADGTRVISTRRRTDVKLVKCTRWEEIRECVSYHCQMAALLGAPTNFRLLNNPGGAAGPQQFGVAEVGGIGGGGGGGSISRSALDKDAKNAESIMRKVYPRGVTPLTEHVLSIYEQILEMTPHLRSDGRRVVVVIATDGLPSDDQGHGGRYQSDQFVQALRLLGSLPVWIVIRLCTDDAEVVRFYNEIDDQLELELEVLDDFTDEAKEVSRYNGWLNYALPLHRCRELGFHDRLLDLLDERPLTKSELSDFCSLLLCGDDENGAWDGSVPDPEVDWDGFVDWLKQRLRKEERQWNPVKRKVGPWINVREVQRVYGGGGGFKMDMVDVKLVIISIAVVMIIWFSFM